LKSAGRRARLRLKEKPKRHNQGFFKSLKPNKLARHIGCSRKKNGRAFLGLAGGQMYFAVMILIAIVVVAAVLVLEHRGDPNTLEREYGLRRTRFKDKK
jgi:hypothetical protein